MIMAHAAMTIGHSHASGVELRQGYVRVHFHVGHGDFHLRWLRHNCDQDRHPQTGERTACSSELPDVLGIDHAEVVEDELRVRWSHDGRTSRFALGWLEEHAYARDRVEATAPPSALSAFVREGSGRPLDQLVAEALDGVRVRGAAVIRRGASTLRPEDETEPLIDAFGERGLRLVATHFGRVEDLRVDNVTNANTDQLGYTNAAVEPHTDQPFLDEPPRYQVLQCIRKADLGGDNYLVDGLLAARYLENLDADAFRRLCGTPIPFHRKQKGFERVVEVPLLSMGPPFRIRSSYFTVAPYRLPFAEMEAWYRAHDRFAGLVRDPRHQVQFTLEPGDFLLYDNHRMLHARTAFRGARWVRGMYFDP
jgi:alpha-ketoglutarate-dependent taurine dioxygenase